MAWGLWAPAGGCQTLQVLHRKAHFCSPPASTPLAFKPVVRAPPCCREVLRCVARTALRTKLAEGLADQLTDIVVDAVLTIQKPDQPLDLHMVGSLDSLLAFSAHAG